MQTELTGIESTFDEEEIIVSKTDRNGRITYANDVFLRVAGYREREVIGQPHSIIRHPDMPRCVFKLLWDTLELGQEIFAYVVNLARNGDHYWVFAHVTPTFASNGAVVGYHSNRRKPDRAQIEKVQPLYATLLAAERRHAVKADQIAASTALLQQFLAERRMAYDEFVFSL
jgi:PAS domain S-box-containing protein